MRAPESGDGDLRSDCAGVVRPIARSLLATCVVIVAIGFSSLFAFAESTPEKNVLVLYSWSVRDAFVELEPLKTTLRSRIHAPVNFYVEYLESQRFGSADYQKAVSETLRQSYGGRQVDLVVVSGYPALQFATDHRDQLFPSIPIVFIDAASNRLQQGVPWPGVTGVVTYVDVRGSLDLALRLHPDTQNVAVVAGKSAFEVFWTGAIREEVGRRQEKLNLIEISTASTKQLLEQVSGLPLHTVVFFHLIPQESSQAEVEPFDALAAIARKFPTYGVHEYCLGHGVIGGSYIDRRTTGGMGGEMAARVLSGEKPEIIPVMDNSAAHFVVDWRELRRWNISQAALPPGTIVLYREPTVWERYEKYVIAGAVLIIVQALLIVGLLWQRARKRKAEAVLRESEKRFRVMANTTPSLVWMSDENGRVIYVNDRQAEFTGQDSQAESKDPLTSFVHPDDLENVLAQNATALEKRERFSREYRLRRRDGVYRWMLDVAAPRINGDDKFAGFIGSASDITDQKLAQEALERVGGQLIEAQEQERSRIARELHDDICQRLALISLELQQASQNSSSSDPETEARMLEIQQHCSEVTGDVQALSHQLHSSKLDYLGLVAALRSFCKEFSHQHKINVEFDDENVPNPLPRDVSLCLFRVAQEALSNATKYSGAKRVSVELYGSVSEIQLEIRDAGIGFNVEEARQRTGLGLMSMQERVHMVNGTFHLESKRNHGTRIIATVPVKIEAESWAASSGVG